jgi:hypothetical protein
METPTATGTMPGLPDAGDASDTASDVAGGQPGEVVLQLLGGVQTAAAVAGSGRVVGALVARGARSVTAGSRPAGVPFDDPLRLPDARPADLTVGVGHLPASAIGRHRVCLDAEVLGDVRDGPPLGVGVGCRCHRHHDIGPSASLTGVPLIFRSCRSCSRLVSYDFKSYYGPQTTDETGIQMHANWPDQAEDGDFSDASRAYQSVCDASSIDDQRTGLDDTSTVEAIHLLMADLPDHVRLQTALDLHTECDPPRIFWSNLLVVLALVVVGSLVVTRAGVTVEDQAFVLGGAVIACVEQLWYFGRSVVWVFGYRRFVARRSA